MDQIRSPAAALIALRPARAEDLESLRAIYAHHVETSLATFEEVAPDAAEMRRRFDDVRERGFPWLVAERDGRLVGYAYANIFRGRSAYRFTVEDSIYVADGCQKQGVGRTLLGALIEACAAIGVRQMIAVTGDVPGSRSIAFHSALGFERAGTLKAVGYKHGQWIDAAILQRAIGPGAATDPA